MLEQLDVRHCRRSRCTRRCEPSESCRSVFLQRWAERKGPDLLLKWKLISTDPAADPFYFQSPDSTRRTFWQVSLFGVFPVAPKQDRLVFLKRVWLTFILVQKVMGCPFLVGQTSGPHGCAQRHGRSLTKGGMLRGFHHEKTRKNWFHNLVLVPFHRPFHFPHRKLYYLQL